MTYAVYNVLKLWHLGTKAFAKLALTNRKVRCLVGSMRQPMSVTSVSLDIIRTCSAEVNRKGLESNRPKFWLAAMTG